MKLELDRRGEIVGLCVVIVLALFFRFYRLDAIPPGLYHDEAANGVDALRVLRGDTPVFFEANNGREPLPIYVMAASIGMFGRNPLAIRGLVALVGTITVLATYFLVKGLLSGVSDSPRLLALLTSVWLALSYWHISFSRIGYDGIFLPLLSSLSFYFLWRGWNLATGSRGRVFLFALSGVFLGLSLYTYRASRFLPVLVLLFVVCFSIINVRGKGLRGWWSPDFRLVLLVLLVALLVFSPLAYYFLHHPDFFFKRASQVSIFNPRWNQGSVPRTLLRNIWQTIGMFFIPKGDPNLRHNPAERPIFDPFTAFFCVLGTGVALRNLKKGPYLFILLWVVVMSLPSILTGELVPHSLRSIGMLPAVYVLPAIGMVVLWGWVGRKWPFPARDRISWLSLSVVFIVVGTLTYRDYFMPWEGRWKWELQWEFEVPYYDAARAMNQWEDEEGVWILPLSPSSSTEAEQYFVDFVYQGHTPYALMPMGEDVTAEELSLVCQGKERAWLIQLLDLKGLASFLLNKFGRLVGEREFQGLAVKVYELPDPPQFVIAESFEPVSVDFGDEMKLTGVSYGGSSIYETSTPAEVEAREIPSGKSGWVVLGWEALRGLERDHTASVRLVDGKGRLVGQVDKLLLSSYIEPTSGWALRQVEMDYYTLPTLAATPPGEYYLEVALYDAETLVRLPIISGGVSKGLSYRFGRLKVVRPLEAAQVEPAVKREVEIAPGMMLLGYDLVEGAVAPGDTLNLALYWEALRDIGEDYALSLRLEDREGQVWVEQRGRPVDGEYPTTEWRGGEVLRDWHDLRLSADVAPGEYRISLGVRKGALSVGEVDLGTILVMGRAHLYEVPQIQHPMEMALGEEVKLLGYDLNPQETNPGGSLTLTLYWQALGEMEKSYTVFTHLLGPDGRIWGQMDGIPLHGTAPTTSWVIAEIIADTYEIPVDPQAGAGQYVLEVGMYLGETGERLSVYNIEGELLGNRILLPLSIEVQ